ncbi:MAG: lytic transglycosylase domain-containing protein [Acutalibacteraceae bacterium]|nr:lytic transglycosylase domain-containing protein [Acutalibacteraceae bacterium]
MTEITTKHRKKRPLYFGGIVAIIISCAIVLIAVIVVVIILISSTKSLGQVMHPHDYDEYVYKYSEEYEIEPNLVFAIMKAESNFDPEAESHVGAIGLMQLMPETFEWLQTYKDGEVTMDSSYLYDPEINIQYGCLFLDFLLDRYTVEETAVAAYNAGFGAVDGWLENSKYSSDGMTLSYIPYPETSLYVEKVETAKNFYDNNGDN